MKDFRSYSPEDIIYANLQETARSITMLCEQELAHLRELAAEITKDVADDPALIASLSELFPQAPKSEPEGLTQNMEALRSIKSLHEVWQSVYLCTEVCRRIGEKTALAPEIFFADADGLSENAIDRIAYQRSSYADTAYLKFAELLETPRAFYTHSFPAACEEVYNGICEYCLLPLENTSEGRLNSFTRLIDRFGLKIAATCSVSAADGSRATQFALLRRQLVPLQEQSNEDLFFECALPNDAVPTVSELLCAAQLCRMSLVRVESRTHPTDTEPRVYTHLSLDVREGDLSAFLLYLLTQAPESEFLGLYPHLK